MASMKDRLKQIRKHWDGAREGAAAGDNLPEGKYVAWLSGEIGESQNGRLQIHWSHRIARGELAGQVQNAYDGLETPENLTWLARKMARLDYDYNEVELERLDEWLDEVNAAQHLVQIQVKENGDFVNTYLNKLLDPSEYDDLVPPGSSAPSPAINPSTTFSQSLERVTWHDLATAADNDDAVAQDRLAEAGMSYGITQKEQDAMSWEELADAILEKIGAPSQPATPDFVAMGKMAEEGDDGVQHQLTTAGQTAGLSQEDMDGMSWEELGDHLAGLQATEQNHAAAGGAIDWAAVGADAEGGNEEAQNWLTEQANAASISQVDQDGMSWEELAAALAGGVSKPATVATATIGKGSKVWFVKDGKAHQGVVIKVQGNNLTVDCDGHQHTIAKDRCEVLDGTPL